MMGSSTPNNSENQANSPDNTKSGATENKPKLRLSLKKPQPEQKQVTKKALVTDTEGPPPLSSLEDVSAALLVPEIEEPSPVPKENKLSTKQPISPPQKIESEEEEREPQGDNVKPPPKVKKSNVPKVETAGVKKTKSTLTTGAFFTIAAAFIFVALLFIGAIYLITQAFISDTTEPPDEDAITQEVIPLDPAPSPSIVKSSGLFSDIQSPYMDPGSDFGKIYTNPDSPFSEPTDTKEASPTITRNIRPSIAKAPSPSQPPNSGESLTEDTASSNINYAPPPVVHKPTPDPAVVDFLNSLVVQGVKSKGDRHAALLNGTVYNVNSTISDELEIRLIKVDGSARHLIFKDKNGVRYRKPY